VRCNSQYIARANEQERPRHASRPIIEVSNRRRANQTPRVANRVDQTEAGGRSRFAQEQRGHRPEDRIVTEHAAAANDEESDHHREIVSSRKEQISDANYSQRNCAMSAALSSLVRMPAVQEHACYPNQPGKRDPGFICYSYPGRGLDLTSHAGILARHFASVRDFLSGRRKARPQVSQHGEFRH